MIDFHSHILPEFDDGSRSLEETAGLLRMSYEQGIRCMAATPHFYAAKESPAAFLKRREEALKRIQHLSGDSVPSVIAGAEVYYYAGITKSDDLKSLCFAGTEVLLLEMPFSRWSEGMVSDVLELSRRRAVTVVLAHIDRYLSMQDKKIWDILKKQGVLFQLNASAISQGILKSRESWKLLKKDRIAVIGSDCHNLDSRTPNLGLARSLIEKKLGPEYWNHLQNNAAVLLGTGN